MNIFLRILLSPFVLLLSALATVIVVGILISLCALAFALMASIILIAAAVVLVILPLLATFAFIMWEA